jgi:hypothetical protein
METAVPTARRRFRLSVRATMAVVLAIAVGLGWYLHTVRTQQAAVRAIKEAGGSVSYDWEWGNYDPNISSTMGKSRAPKWLSDRLGVDYVANVTHASLVPGRGNKRKADDQTLESVGRLSHLESLWLNGTAVTDAGMVHLKGMSRLSDLTLGAVGVTDAGLAQLTGLSNLRTLHVTGSRVTDTGVLALEEALPRLQILREEDVVDPARTTRAMNDLAFAASLPSRLAAPMLMNRAKAMNARGDMAGLIASMAALSTLEADNIFDLIKIAEARGECLGILEPTFSPRLSATERRRLHKLCEDRGIDALTLAVEKGYNNIRRLDGDILETRMVGNLRKHPAYPRLVEILRARRSGDKSVP